MAYLFFFLLKSYFLLASYSVVFQHFHDYISHNPRVCLPRKKSGVQRVQQRHSGSVCQQRCGGVRSRVSGRSLRGLWWHVVGSVDARGRRCGARVAGLQGRSDAHRSVWMCGTGAADPSCERGGECGKSSLEDPGTKSTISITDWMGNYQRCINKIHFMLFFFTVTLALRVCYSTISAHSKSIHTHIMCICASCLSVLTELQNINKEHTVHWLSLIHVSWSCWLDLWSAHSSQSCEDSVFSKADFGPKEFS